MAKVRFEIKPSLQKLKLRNKKRIKQLDRLRIPNAQISVMLDRWVQLNFRTQGGFVGRWKKLRAGGRFVPGFGLDTTAKILQDAGRLRASFLPFSTSKNAGIGSDISYAKKHEFGENKLPVRRMLPKESEVRADIKDIYTRFIRKNLPVRPEKIKR